MASSLSNFVGQELTWIPTALFKSRYNLTASDGTVLATLDMSRWRWKAQATVSGGTPFIQRDHWYSSKISIYAAERGPLIATYQRKWAGASGQIVFLDGRLFKWSRSNFRGTQKVWTDLTGNTIYVQLSKGFSRKSTVLIYPQATEMPELSLLVVLGLYNIIMERREAAAAS